MVKLCFWCGQTLFLISKNIAFDVVKHCFLCCKTLLLIWSNIVFDIEKHCFWYCNSSSGISSSTSSVVVLETVVITGANDSSLSWDRIPNWCHVATSTEGILRDPGKRNRTHPEQSRNDYLYLLPCVDSFTVLYKKQILGTSLRGTLRGSCAGSRGMHPMDVAHNVARALANLRVLAPRNLWLRVFRGL